MKIEELLIGGVVGFFIGTICTAIYIITIIINNQEY